MVANCLGRTRVQLATRKHCIGCMACVDICPKGAISQYLAEDGHSYVKVSDDKCVRCKKCEKLCASIHQGYGNNDLELSVPFAAWAINTKLRQAGTSGGIFAAIASYVIDRGGIVIGAKFDGKNCRHCAISKKSEINSLQGSKYVRSDTEGIFRLISSYISSKLVLFSGVGCQASAVISYFKNHPKRNNLVVIDLVCGGVPSSLLMTSFFLLHPEVERIKSFRKKERYCLIGEIASKEVELGDRPLPLCGFQAGATNRFSCMNCRFAYAHRKSDLTIGDLWGDKEFVSEHSGGVSLAICHTDVGIALLNKSEVVLNSLSWSQVLPYNCRIMYGKKYVGLMRRCLPILHRHLNPATFSSLYSFNFKNLPMIFALLAKYTSYRSAEIKARGIREAYKLTEGL